MTTLPGAAALAAETLGRVEQMLLGSLHELSEATALGTDPSPASASEGLDRLVGRRCEKRSDVKGGR